MRAHPKSQVNRDSKIMGKLDGTNPEFRSYRATLSVFRINRNKAPKDPIDV